MREWKPLNDGFSWAWSDLDNAVWVKHDGCSFRGCAGVCKNHTLVSLEPLTLSPSLIMPCGAHGFIRDGRWTNA